MKTIHIIIGMISLMVVFGGCKDKDGDIKAVNITIINAVYESGDISAITVKDNEQVQLEAFIMPSNTTNKSVSYRISGTSTGAMEITESGLITPVVKTPENGTIPNPLGVDTIVAAVNDGSGTFVKYPVRIVSHIVLSTGITIASVAQTMTLEQNQTFDLAPHVTVNPKDVLDPTVSYASEDEAIATVDANGLVTAVGTGGQTTKIIITTNDRAKQKAECVVNIVERFTGPVYLDRTGWTTTLSHTPVVYDATVNATRDANAMIDDNPNTCVLIVKPNRTFASGPAGDQVNTVVPDGAEIFFILDMGEQQTFDYFTLRHRNIAAPGANSTPNLRVEKCKIYGSNDGTNFTQIGDELEINIPHDANKQDVSKEIPESTYRYFKFSITQWNSGGNTIQISEFNIGTLIK